MSLIPSITPIEYLTVTSRNLWRVTWIKFFHPPHLYCVTTLPSITNTTAIIGVYTSVATSWCWLEYLVWGRQGWSSSVLERKLTAHTTAISPSKRACCLTSEQYVVNSSLQVDTAAGLSASAHRPDHDGLSEKRAHQNSFNLYMWRPNSYDINPVNYAIRGALQQ